MDTPYRVVRLQRNHLYPTYQLFAHMASKKTTPQDGLRLAALTTMEWLRLRLGDTVPKELLLPGPEEFRSCSEEALQSLHLSSLRIKKQGEVKNFCRSHPAGPRRIGLAQSSGKSTLPTKE